MRRHAVWRDLLAAGVLLAATPIVLLRLLPPLPALPSKPHDLARVLAQPLAATALPWLICGVAWGLWAALLTAVLLEGWRRVRRQGWPRLRLPGPAQTMSAALLGTVAASTATSPLPAAIHATLSTATDPPQHTATRPGAPDAMVTSGRPAVTQPPDAASATTPIAIHLRGVSTAEGRRVVLAASVAADARPPAAQTLIYQVRRGDWLGGIASRFLGDFNRYPEIQKLNPNLITDPDLIQPAWRLVLPPDASDRGTRRHATGQLIPPPSATPDAAATAPNPGTPGPSGPAPARPKGMPSTPSTSVTATSSALLAPPAIARPQPAGSPASAEAGRPAPSATGSGQPRPRTDPPTAAGHDHQRGVDVPGGWIGLPLAAALVTAAATVWLRRRHRYVPQPVGLEHLDDPDLRPLPPVVTRIRRAVRQQMVPELIDTATAQNPALVDRAANRDHQRLRPTGPAGLHRAGLRSRVPPAGLGLVGPGAHPAGRALLVAMLSTHAPADPDAAGHVVVPASTMRTLLGAEADQFGQIPGLHVTGTLSEALTHLDELLMQRRRLLEDHDAADPPHPPLPPVLLLAQTPPASLCAQLAATLRLGAPLQISAVLIGDWPAGATLTVHHDGHTTGAGADTDRVDVLDVPTTGQLLDVLREAHTAPAGRIPPDQTPHPADNPAAAPPPHSNAPHPAQPASTAPVADADPLNAGTSTPSAAPEAAPDAPPAPDAADAARPAATRPGTNAAAATKHTLRLPVGIQLLGEPRILDQDGNPIPGLRHHARELLVYLTVHRSGANLSTIMEAFWPNANLSRAEQRLSTEAGNLRRRIREAAGDQHRAIQPVINTGGRYHLDPNLLDIDAWRLADALRQAGTATDPDARITALRQAVDAHSGPLAAGHDYDWIEQPREQLRRYGIRARVSLAEALAPRGHAHRAAHLLRAAADLDPINEDLARQAIHALAETGDATAVRAQLQQLRTALGGIDEEPSTETIALAARLLREIADKDPESGEDPPDDPTSATTG